VALFALRAEPRFESIVFAPYPMTVVAGRRRPSILILDVTGRAGHCLVSPFKAKREGIMEGPVRRLELRRGDQSEDRRKGGRRNQEGKGTPHSL
jgi:hypothetical protein